MHTNAVCFGSVVSLQHREKWQEEVLRDREEEEKEEEQEEEENLHGVPFVDERVVVVFVTGPFCRRL